MGFAVIVSGISFANSNLGSVTLAETTPLSSLSINGDATVNNSSNTAQYSVEYNPLNTTQRGVTWGIDSGGTYASIDSSTGLLTVLSTANNSTVVVKVTSNIDNTIFATKTVTVTYAHEIVSLEYIAAADGKYISTGITPTATSVITADFKLPSITYSATTERQMVYSDSGNVSCGYNKAFNVFAINYTGGNTKTVTSFNNRGLVTSSKASTTLYDKTNEQSVSLTTSSATSGTYAELRLYNEDKDRQYRKVMIYEFAVADNGSDLINLSPVLYDGVPCFYDSVSDSYIQFSGDSGDIWYATAAEPNTEIQYTE